MRLTKAEKNIGIVIGALILLRVVRGQNVVTTCTNCGTQITTPPIVDMRDPEITTS